MTAPPTDPAVHLTSLALRLFCPRCDKPQETRVRWFGNTVFAYAALQTVPHDCPAAPIPAGPDGLPVPADPLW